LKAAIEGVRYGGCVAITGVASGFGFPIESVAPFVMKALTIVGVNTVTTPIAERRDAWERLFKITNEEDVQKTIRMEQFSELPRLGDDMLNGKTDGRIVVPVK
jgi:acrylyl-CoA reductase (NADPH)